MMETMAIRELDDAGRRGVTTAAALANEQLKYAWSIAQSFAPRGHEADPILVAALVQAIATNYAAVK
ncbi:MAG: hypothetical protein JWQ76_2079 [Ramlibacter sp.]|nr:hypothetical protein [Ramlibacter sp.]